MGSGGEKNCRDETRGEVQALRDFWEVLLSSIIEMQWEKLVFLGSVGAAMLNHIWIHSTRLLKYHRGAYWHISMKTPWPH